jgi:hypothetical protein
MIRQVDSHGALRDAYAHLLEHGIQIGSRIGLVQR